ACRASRHARILAASLFPQDSPPPALHTLSLHDALPISAAAVRSGAAESSAVARSAPTDAAGAAGAWAMRGPALGMDFLPELSGAGTGQEAILARHGVRESIRRPDESGEPSLRVARRGMPPRGRGSARRRG